jgi:hypothetical protein
VKEHPVRNFRIGKELLRIDLPKEAHFHCPSGKVPGGV